MSEAQADQQAQQIVSTHGAELRRLGLFERPFYAGRYSDVIKAGIDPLWHYIRYGHAEGRWPSSRFDTTYYRNAYLGGDPTVVPVLHFLTEGRKQGLPTNRAEERIRGHLREASQRRKRLVIHVGFDKTGSSSIQHTLFNAEARGFDYIHFGNPNPSHPMNLILSPDTDEALRHYRQVTQHDSDEAAVAELTEAFFDQIRNGTADTCILSAESLSKLSMGGLKILSDLARKLFRKVEVIAFVRAQRSYMESRFQHGVRTTGKQDFGVGVNYRARLRRLDRAFGRNKVTLVKFDPTCLRDGDVVVDFISRAGIDVPTEALVRVNESLPLEAIAILFNRNRLGKADLRFVTRRALAVRLSRFGIGKLKFCDDFAARMVAGGEEDIAWSEARMGVSLRDAPAPSDTCINSGEDLIAIALDQHQAVLDGIAEDLSTAQAGSSGAAVGDLARRFETLKNRPADAQVLADLVDLWADILMLRPKRSA